MSKNIILNNGNREIGAGNPVDLWLARPFLSPRSSTKSRDEIIRFQRANMDEFEPCPQATGKEDLSKNIYFLV